MVSSPLSISVLNKLIDRLRSLAAMASVSLNIELVMDGVTRSSIISFVILLSGWVWADEMSLSISFESCHRFGPTCWAK